MAAALPVTSDRCQSNLVSPYSLRYAPLPSPPAATSVFPATLPVSHPTLQGPFPAADVVSVMQPPTALLNHQSHSSLNTSYFTPTTPAAHAPLLPPYHPHHSFHAPPPHNTSALTTHHIAFESPPQPPVNYGHVDPTVMGPSKVFSSPPLVPSMTQQPSGFVSHHGSTSTLPPPILSHQAVQTHPHPLDPYADALLLSEPSYCPAPAHEPRSLPLHAVQRQPHSPPVYYGSSISPLVAAQAPLVDLSLQSILAVPPLAVEEHHSFRTEVKVTEFAARKTLSHQSPHNMSSHAQPEGSISLNRDVERQFTHKSNHSREVDRMHNLQPLPPLVPTNHDHESIGLAERHELHRRRQQAHAFNLSAPDCAPLVSTDDVPAPVPPFFSAASNSLPAYLTDSGRIVSTYASPSGLLLQQSHMGGSQHVLVQQSSSEASPLEQIILPLPTAQGVVTAPHAQQANQLSSIQVAFPDGVVATSLSYPGSLQQQPATILLSPLQGHVDHVAPQAVGHVHDVGLQDHIQLPPVSAANIMGVPDLLAAAQFSVPADMLEPYMAVGRACRDIGRYDLASSTFRACMTICPESNEARAAYNSSCYDQGFYESGMELGPVFPEDVFNDVGNSLRSIGRSTEAEMAYRGALSIAPRHAHAWNNLGNAMRGRGAILDAMQCYTASLSAQPGFAAAHCNLAGLLRDQGKPQDAEAQYRAALLSDPNLAEAAAGLGTALRDMGRTEEAISFYVRAVSLQPDGADHHANLANTYKDLNRIEESIMSYQAALALQPDLPDAFCNMVHSLSVICDWTNREHNFATLLAIIDRQLDTLLRHPATHPRLYNTLVGALSNSTPQLVDVCGGSRSDRDNTSVPATSREENSMDRPRRKYVHHPSSPSIVKNARVRGKSARFVTGAPSVVAPVLTSGLPSVQPFHALIYPMSPEKFRALSAAYASRAESVVTGIPLVTQRWSVPRGPSARLKVGYVSSDYNNHPYSHLTQSIYGLHRTGTTVECYCYALTPSDHSAWRLRIEQEVEHFRDISSLSPKQSAEAIAHDGIHVLVNCNGYTKGARTELFALRPAPVQVSFMGFAGTLGAHYIEYFITDVVTSPPEMASRMHSEALLYHPHSYFVNDHRQTSFPGPSAFPSGPLTRAHYGLPENCFLFIMHNQLYKLSPDTFDVWARILKRVPGSKLWLLRFPPTGEQRIRQEAAARGLSADRLIFTDVAGKDEHVARAGLGDLFLDTPTCNAHTTGTDVLWSGVPMITCPGSLFASRVAASLLTAAGVPELIASDMIEYEDLAVDLATNHEKLAVVRAKIEASRLTNALFDTERWVRNVEALYWRAWRNCEMGKPPDHIFGRDVYDGSTMTPRTSAVESMYSTTDSRRSETLRYGTVYNSGVVA